MIIQLKSEQHGLTLADVKEGQMFESPGGNLYVKNGGAAWPITTHIKPGKLHFVVTQPNGFPPNTGVTVARIIKTIGIDPVENKIVIDYHENQTKQLTFWDVPVGRLFRSKSGLTFIKTDIENAFRIADGSSKWHPGLNTALFDEDEPVEAISTEIIGINW